MGARDEYSSETLRLIRSHLIVSSLQERKDIRAIKLIMQFRGKLSWRPLSNLSIDPAVWNYAVKGQRFDPKLVFCHPEVLLYNPTTSVYYRGLCGLSLKAVRDYFGAVDALEDGKPGAALDEGKALKMAQTYNRFICSIMRGITNWTLENGKRTVIATLGITLDGKMRNMVGKIAEDRVKRLILEWLIERDLILDPRITKEELSERLPKTCTLKEKVIMQLGSEPDVSFTRDNVLQAVVEIKGGVDPAGALERYGAATKSFRQASSKSSHCKNFYLGAVYTAELDKRIRNDALVEKTFDIIKILHDPETRERFFTELFLYTLRVI